MYEADQESRCLQGRRSPSCVCLSLVSLSLSFCLSVSVCLCLSLSVCACVCGEYMYEAMYALQTCYLGARDPNSGPHAYTAGTY